MTIRSRTPASWTSRSHLLKPGDNQLSLSVHRGDPRVISELWLEDVELMVRYGG